jgi:hypothetical protein
MERIVIYRTMQEPFPDAAPGWDRILEEREMQKWSDADLEMVLTYVPEAGEMRFTNALELAKERDEAAAEALRSDFIQIASI